MEETKQHTAKANALKKILAERIRIQVGTASNAFNQLDQKSKRRLLIVFILIASIYPLILLMTPFVSDADEIMGVDRITLPMDLYNKENPMKQQQAQQLIPVGKMKGEIDGKFEAFYLALDQEGQLYINRDPPYGEERFMKSNGWETISNEQFRTYEEQLHFIPHAQKGLKP